MHRMQTWMVNTGLAVMVVKSGTIQTVRLHMEQIRNIKRQLRILRGKNWRLQMPPPARMALSRIKQEKRTSLLLMLMRSLLKPPSQ